MGEEEGGMGLVVVIVVEVEEIESGYGDKEVEGE